MTGGVAADGITVHTTLPMGALPRCMLDTPSSRRQWSSATCRVASSARLVAYTVRLRSLFVPDYQPAGRVSTEPDHEGEPLTSAEMTPAEKNAISHRGKALKALVPAIEALLH